MGTNPSLRDSASARLARSAPKKSSTAFISQIRNNGKRIHTGAMAQVKAKAMASQADLGPGMSPRAPVGGAGNFKPGAVAPKGANGTVAYGGRYGLQVPASQAFTALENRYAQQFGTGFIVNDGWRSYANQVEAKQKQLRGGPVAATPGHSTHGWGTAVDLGGPIGNTNTAQHAWLRQNAAQFGWHWVGQRYGEPWHWEYHP